MRKGTLNSSIDVTSTTNSGDGNVDFQYQKLSLPGASEYRGYPKGNDPQKSSRKSPNNISKTEPNDHQRRLDKQNWRDANNKQSPYTKMSQNGILKTSGNQAFNNIKKIS